MNDKETKDAQQSDEDSLLGLYSQKILALASAIPLTAPLEKPYIAGSARAPLCGSTINVRLRVSEHKIRAFSQDVRACVLGQAAASIIGANIIGCSCQKMLAIRDELRAMLRGSAKPPEEPFAELKVLMPARAYKNRHASILLCCEATLSALASTNSL